MSAMTYSSGRCEITVQGEGSIMEDSNEPRKGQDVLLLVQAALLYRVVCSLVLHGGLIGLALCCVLFCYIWLNSRS